VRGEPQNNRLKLTSAELFAAVSQVTEPPNDEMKRTKPAQG